MKTLQELGFTYKVDNSSKKMLEDYVLSTFKRTEDTHVNRASSAGYCSRRRWYQKNGYPQPPLDARRQFTFLEGNIVEASMISFIKDAWVGEGRLYSEIHFGQEIGQVLLQGKMIKSYDQITNTADVGGITFSSHFDFIGKRWLDGEWELGEIKSTTPYTLKKLKGGAEGYDGPPVKEAGLDYAYACQSHVNMMTNEAKALGVKSARILFYNKMGGQPYVAYFDFFEPLWQEIIQEAKLANAEDKPPRWFELQEETKERQKDKVKFKEPTGRWLCYWACQYCPFTKECQGDYIVEFKSDPFGESKPTFIFEKKPHHE